MCQKWLGLGHASPRYSQANRSPVYQAIHSQSGLDISARCPTEFTCHASPPSTKVGWLKHFEYRLRLWNDGARFIEHTQQRLCKSRHVPQPNRRLVLVSVSSMTVDGAKDCAGLIAVHKRTRAKVDGLASDGHVIGIHDAVDKSDEHPSSDQCGLNITYFCQKGQGAVWRRPQVRIVSLDCVIRSCLSLALSPRAAKYSKVPIRIWLDAMRVTTAPGRGVSR